MKGKAVEVLNHCTDILPVGGGVVGANISTATGMMPSFSSLVFVFVISLVGAITGYMVKLILDWIFKKLDK